MNKKTIFLLSFIVMILAACTAGANNMLNAANPAGEVAGFWQGLWHGFIFPFTFIVSLFKDGLNVYEVHNNGNWYNFGFLFGAIMIFGGGGKGCCRKKKR